MTRNWSCIMTNLLTSAGDLGAAEATCAAGLARAREADDLWVLSELLNFMSELDLQANRTQDAAAHLGEALRIASRTGGGFEVLNGLHRCAWLCAATGRPADALTAWAAFAASCQRAGTWLPRDRDPRHPLQEALNAARQALGPDRARAAEERDAAMSLETATEYALMLTTPAPQPPGRGPGPGKLSTRERELVALVARGRTDAQIAAELYISVRTVRTHLDRIRDKTGYRRRADLTRLALQASLA
jgi:DNA-binding CsgD family transcriptional regulator